MSKFNSSFVKYMDKIESSVLEALDNIDSMDNDELGEFMAFMITVAGQTQYAIMGGRHGEILVDDPDNECHIFMKTLTSEDREAYLAYKETKTFADGYAEATKKTKETVH